MMRDLQILGKNVSFSADPSVSGINSNTLVIGGTDTGKTMSIEEPELIHTYDRSVIVTMTKQKLVRRYSQMFASRGYEIKVLNFADPSSSTCSFDPMHYLHSDSDIRNLASTIVKCDSYGNKNIDPYWDNAAISLLSSLIALVRYGTKKPNFTDVLDLFHHMESNVDDYGISSSNINHMFTHLASIDPDNYALHGWKAYNNLSVRTASCVFSVMAAAMENVFTPEIEQIIKIERDIDFSDLGKKRTALFIITSPFSVAMNHFVSILYSTAFKELFEYAETMDNGILPVPVHVFCDDFATGAPIDRFPEYISIFREKGVSVTILCQSESQLKSLYDENGATTIINNCDTYVYLGGMDLQSARSVSERMNIPLEDVLYMPVGQIFICRRGMRPIKTVRYDIQSNTVYQALIEEIG